MRTVCWFSCGAASAVATKFALLKCPEAIVANVVVRQEHEDNSRFLGDCQKWFNAPIKRLINKKYDGDCFSVYMAKKYIVGVSGAPCTQELKKWVREQFQELNDRQVFGYTIEEEERVSRFLDANPDVDLWTPLIEMKINKQDCFEILKREKIKLPKMYELGYKNNNCIGCVKGGAGYWNKIRKDFPTTFARMAKTERLIGAKILKIKGERVFLDELPIGAGRYEEEQDIGCGIFCHMALDKLHK